MPEPLLSVREVAEWLNVSADCVYRLVAARELPHCRVGKAIRFERRDVAAYLEAHRVAAAIKTPPRGQRSSRLGGLLPSQYMFPFDGAGRLTSDDD
jgi:excisionase family DNA binding protein